MNKEEISKRIDEGLQMLKQEPSFIFHPEEIKAIEHITKRHKFVSQNPLATNIFTTYDAHCLGTALNLISKLQKENEELKDYHDRTKHTIKIAKMHRKENEILKKVINLMAKPIAGLKLYDFNRKEYFTLEDEGEVKEYFYKKVEEENE